MSTINWVSRSWIDCVIYDSGFASLVDSIHTLVQNKTNHKIPKFIVDLVVKLIDWEITNRSYISIESLWPIDYVKDIHIPAFMIIGNKDEMVD